MLYGLIFWFSKKSEFGRGFSGPDCRIFFVLLNVTEKTPEEEQMSFLNSPSFQTVFVRIMYPRSERGKEV